MPEHLERTVNTMNLRDLLELSIEGEPTQRSAREDLARAQFAVRRRRVRWVLGASAVTFAAVAVWTAWPGGVTTTIDLAAPRGPGPEIAATTYVPPDWAPRTSRYEPEVVSEEEALARCNAIEYTDGSPDGDTVLPYSRPIHAGDNVEISGTALGTITNPDGTTRPGEIACTVPGSFTWPGATEPEHHVRADDIEAILLGCSDLAHIDLRDWVVSAAMADGVTGVNAMLVSADQRFYANCELGDGHREIWFSHDQTLEDAHGRDPEWGQLGLNTAEACEAAGTACDLTIYSRSNVLPTGMESAIIRLGDGSTIEVPVGIDGSYAVRFVLPVDAPEPVIETYGADGTLVLSCVSSDCPA